MEESVYDKTTQCKTCGKTLRIIDAIFTLTGYLCPSCSTTDEEYQEVMASISCHKCGNRGATWHQWNEYSYGYYCSTCADSIGMQNRLYPFMMLAFCIVPIIGVVISTMIGIEGYVGGFVGLALLIPIICKWVRMG